MAGSHNLIEYLERRRTVPAQFLRAPGPDEGQLNQILRIGARVPDHGKLAPWRFVVYTQDMAAEIGGKLAQIALDQAQAPETIDEAQEKSWFDMAPITIGVISSARPHVKIPVIEQTLSAGAVCLNIMHAAHGLGFSAQWVTRWFAFDPLAKKMLGAQDDEIFAGFVHIGTPQIAPVERDRPNMDALVQHWTSAELK